MIRHLLALFRRGYVLCYCLVFCATTGYAQDQREFTVNHFTTAQGLSNEWVSDIIQDTNGYLWIATQYGINRFDGREFTAHTYRPDEVTGPPGNWTKSLLESGNNQLWLGSLGRGLNVMNTRTERFSSPEKTNGWPDFRVVDQLFEDSNGRRWAATSAGTFIQQRTGEVPKKFSLPRLRCLAETANGTVLGGGPKGIWALTEGGGEQLTDQVARALLPLGNDSLLFVSEDRIRLLVRQSNRWQLAAWQIDVSYDYNPFYLPRFAKAPDGTYWLAEGPVVRSIRRDLSGWRAYLRAFGYTAFFSTAKATFGGAPIGGCFNYDPLRPFSRPWHASARRCRPVSVKSLSLTVPDGWPLPKGSSAGGKTRKLPRSG